MKVGSDGCPTVEGCIRAPESRYHVRHTFVIAHAATAPFRVSFLHRLIPQTMTGASAHDPTGVGTSVHASQDMDHGAGQMYDEHA
jgi:hypothetical protein